MKPSESIHDQLIDEIDDSETPFPPVDYLETPELGFAQATIVEELTRDIQRPDAIEASWHVYGEIKAATLEHLPKNEKLEAEMGFMLHASFIFQQAGQWERFIQELERTHTFASQHKQFAFQATMLQSYIDHLKQNPQ